MISNSSRSGAFAIVLAAALCAPAAAQEQASTVCTFTTGPRAGANYDYAQIGWQPLAVGTPCADGAGNTGYVGGVASAAARGSTVCRFTAGPRAGSSFDYQATWEPLPVGTPCLDGAGSTGIVR